MPAGCARVSGASYPAILTARSWTYPLYHKHTYILPGIPGLLKQGGVLVSLIKPQFEAGRGAVGKGGIVKSPRDRLFAVQRVLDCARVAGFGCLGLMTSPITGGDGNVEYLVALRLGEETFPEREQVEKIITGGLPWKK